MRVTGLFTYPVKSLRGIEHSSRSIVLRGLVGDRLFMVVDGENHFITQRDMGELAQISTIEEDGNTFLQALDGASIPIAFDDVPTRVNAIVWDSVVHTPVASATTNEALSEALGQTVKVVAMDDKSVRMVDDQNVGPDTPVSFADAYPVLITNEKSLDALNDTIIEQGDEKIPMARFRPNIVVDGFDAWDEDRWLVVRIGDVVFDAVKPCDRCVVTTRDQQTGRSDGSNQPVRAMIKTRRSGDKSVSGVLFGWNLVPRAPGNLQVNDEVEVLERRERWPIAANMT